MNRAGMNRVPDLERRVTEWLRADAAPSGSERVLAAALDRVAVTGQDRAFSLPSFGGPTTARRLALIAVTAALLALLTATAIFVGSHLRTEPVPLPLPIPTDAAVPSVPFVPTPPPVPVAIAPTTLGSGTAATEIGPLSWTAVAGDASNIPATQIFAKPGGFGAIEPDPGAKASRFWVSPDGIEWSVAPMPVPARGSVGHALVVGEHWIWSPPDFRLWHSSDFASWTELDLAALRPPAIEGVRWSMNGSAPVTAGSTTVMRWSVIGNLALDELLGIALEPDETLMVGAAFDNPVLGQSQDVYKVRQTVIGPDDATRTRVGSIRVELNGQIATVVDDDRDRVVAEIDASKVGEPAEEMATDLYYGFVRGPGQGMRIAKGSAQPLALPADVANLVAINDRFVALTDDDSGGPRHAWSSADGLDWEDLGPLQLPSQVSFIELLPTDTYIGLPLSAVAMVDEGTPHDELWTSADGRTWTRVAVLGTYPEPGLHPIAGPNGYLAPGDDFLLHVSPSGADWTVVDGPTGLHQSVDENGGTQVISVTPDTVFYVELPSTGERRLWAFKIEGAPGQPSAAPLD